LHAKLGPLSPLRVLERGYAIVSNARGVVKNAEDAPPESCVNIRLAKGTLDAVVLLKKGLPVD
jgi:exonuclease VII large subunit